MLPSSTALEVEETGKVEQWHNETEIEWAITDIFSLAENKNVINSRTFHFANISWLLKLKLKSDIKRGCMCLFLGKIDSHDCSVEYDFGLKKPDYSVEHLTKGIFKGVRKWSGPCYIKLSKVKKRKSELVSSGALKITCKLKREATDSGGQSKIIKLNKLISK